MTDNRVFFRGYAEVADDESARGLCDEIIALVVAREQVIASRVQRYWKIPEQFELFFDCEPSEDMHLFFEKTLRVLGSGWEVHRFDSSGSWAVWNRGAENRFCRPQVTWANVECHGA